MTLPPPEVQEALKNARTAYRSGDMKSARRWAEKAASLAPELEEPWLWLSAVATPRASLEYARRALQANPNSQRARQAVAWAESRYQPEGKPQTADGMAESDTIILPEAAAEETARPPARGLSIHFPWERSTAVRVIRYSFIRAVVLFMMVAISVYLTMLIAVNGTVIESETSGNKFKGWLTGIEEFRTHAPFPGEVEDTRPPVIKHLNALWNGLTLNWGNTDRLAWNSTNSTATSVKEVISLALPRTIILFSAANFLLFFSSISVALLITRKYGSWLDRSISSLSILSAVPAWLIGIVIKIFAIKVLHIYFGGQLNEWPTEFSWSYIGFFLRHMGLPIAAIFIGKIFSSIYAWRTFFVINSEEDYIDLAKAKGVPGRQIERRHILRPVLPNVITGFSMMTVSIWQDAIIIELFFSVTGVGQLFYRALQIKDLPLIIGLTVTFGYLMALTVFLLDIIYAWVDPRVRIGGEKSAEKAVSMKSWLARLKELTRDPFDRKERAWLKAKRAANIVNGLNGYTYKRQPVDFKKTIQDFIRPIKLIYKYPSAILGLIMILIMVAGSIYAVIALPYNQVKVMWNQEPTRWRDNPAKAMPVWTNWFRRSDYPETIIKSSADADVTKIVRPAGTGMNEITIDFKFNYPYGELPSDFTVQLFPKYTTKVPLVVLNWIRPDGSQMEIHRETANADTTYVASLDDRLARKLNTPNAARGLFFDPTSQVFKAEPGTYELQIKAFVFEADADINAKMILEGQVFGLAGTDNLRRDLMVPLLWGAPVALTFGLLGAIFTSAVTMILAAMGVWFGGWIDGIVHRLTEINMLLPTFPILILMYIYYSKSVWIILGAAVLLSVFSSSIKTYRAVFLQVKEQPYIEAAQSYGAGSWRIIFKYMLPRIIPVLVPQLVTLVPGYVFLEATLAYLNMSDPLLPTWGKMIQEGIANGALSGYYYWVLEPVGILLLTSFGFLMFGFTLERILNPRLREV